MLSHASLQISRDSSETRESRREHDADISDINRHVDHP